MNRIQNEYKVKRNEQFHLMRQNSCYLKMLEKERKKEKKDTTIRVECECFTLKKKNKKKDRTIW